MNAQEQMISAGQTVLTLEASTLADLVPSLGSAFGKACEQMLACHGHIICTGMGKSGHIARKIAATLASTGTPAFFVHPGEASHGDLGMITDRDCVLALSASGTTREVLDLIPHLKRANIPLIAITGEPSSELAAEASFTIIAHVKTEACQHNLAPTCSTTAALALGDALAVALSTQRNFSPSDFARSHPGGSLGKRVLLRVDKLMRSGSALPIAKPTDLLRDTLNLIAEKRLGIAVIVDTEGHAIGIFTDGDLRRTVLKGLDTHQTTMHDVMTTSFKTIRSDALATEALHDMETFKITSLVITHDTGQLAGIVHMHDLISAGVL